MYKKPFLYLLAAACVAPAAAENIYRCGDSYSQRPCPGGTVVEVEDERSAVQRSQTSLAAQRDARIADAMEKARLKEEARPVSVTHIPAKAQAPEKAGKPAAARQAKKPEKPEHFTAVAPGKPGEATKKKTKKKAD